MNFKPAGYNALSPYFIVNDVSRFMQLMKDLFAATELSHYTHDDGSTMHVEMRIDDTVIMLSQATNEYPANQFLIHVYVPDAKATYKKAVSLGCEGVQEPVQKDDPDLRGMFKDFDGNMWAVGTRIG